MTAVIASDPLAGTLLHDFTDPLQGDSPASELMSDADGFLYGTTYLGGSPPGLNAGSGTVFRMSPSGQFEVLYRMTAADGQNPSYGLVRSPDGSIYGTASFGGSSDGGTVFRLSPGGDFSTVYAFTRSGADGANPLNLGLARDGSLYGNAGGGDFGNIFAISAAGEYSKIYGFVSTTIGSNPPHPHDGSDPIGKLVQASDGNFYGTTFGGGPAPFFDTGTIFKLTPAGELTTLHVFDGTNGANPVAGLTIGRDGKLYGVTSGGGFSDGGVVFRMGLTGHNFTVLHEFDRYSGGFFPTAQLIEGIDGAFYGVTQQGTGRSAGGTLFRITPEGRYTTLYRFASPIGGNPNALVIGPDGGFYGGLAQGGTTRRGSIFRLLPKYSFKNAAQNSLDPPQGPTSTNVKVTLTNASSASITLPLTVTSDSAAPPGSFRTLPASSITFPPGTTQQTIQVKTRAGFPCNGRITLTIGTASNAAPGDITANTLTIGDGTPQACP